jgi:bacterioferritin (cytochrome b1)
MPVAASAVADALQYLVSAHLTAIEQYEGQRAHFERWGYPKLAEAREADVSEERKHLGRLLDRLEYFDIAPTCEHPAPVWPRHDLVGILAANLALQSGAAAAERASILDCRAAGDELSAKLIAKNLKGSEQGISEIEAARIVIQQVGLDTYLASQM